MKIFLVRNKFLFPFRKRDSTVTRLSEYCILVGVVDLANDWVNEILVQIFFKN